MSHSLLVIVKNSMLLPVAVTAVAKLHLHQSVTVTAVVRLHLHQLVRHDKGMVIALVSIASTARAVCLHSSHYLSVVATGPP